MVQVANFYFLYETLTEQNVCVAKQDYKNQNFDQPHAIITLGVQIFIPAQNTLDDY